MDPTEPQLRGSAPDKTLAGLTDEELAERCKKELPYVTTAFEELVRRHEPKVFKSCLAYLKQAEDAEEISQDVFMRVFRAIRRFEGRSTFRTWLFRIVLNRCATRHARLQREHRRREQLAERWTREEGSSIVEPALLAERDPARADRPTFSGPVGAALAGLSEADVQILVLRHVGEMTLAELAESLGITLSASKMRLYRAEERFRAAYQRKEINPAPDP